MWFEATVDVETCLVRVGGGWDVEWSDGDPVGLGEDVREWSREERGKRWVVEGVGDVGGLERVAVGGRGGKSVLAVVISRTAEEGTPAASTGWDVV